MTNVDLFFDHKFLNTFRAMLRLKYDEPFTPDGSLRSSLLKNEMQGRPLGTQGGGKGYEIKKAQYLRIANHGCCQNTGRG